MKDAQAAAETFLEGARLNRNDALRDGSMLVFPDYGQLVMTGDLHGHRRNFEKLQRFCDLEHFAARHVVLHEIIHEEVAALGACDMSHEILLEAARWKCAFPEQVHVLQSNHEIAQATGHDITKNGRVLTFDFERGVRTTYREGADRVLDTINAWIQSLPLAGRTANRVFLSHSLPGPRDMQNFDPDVLSRPVTAKELADQGTAQAMVWGRYQTEAVLANLCSLLDVDFFLCGHQPQEQGYAVLHGRMVILASDHDHGVFLPLDLGRPATLEKLTRGVRPFAGVR